MIAPYPKPELEPLDPQPVWSHFAMLCAIPRASRHEAELREHLIGWAHEHGVETIVDAVGNLILKKPGSRGHEGLPGVVLQGHLDMVCQANATTRHDFAREPIRAVVRDEWVMADDTTLGADNGIGVALALAAVEDPGLVHPPLEVLLTVNEEDGMDGARGLKPGTLKGRTLINLDTEEWGNFYLGCAGGVDVEVEHTASMENIPAGHVLQRLEVTGLRGGHSGMDIHLGRGNAVKLITEALRSLAAVFDLRLVGFQGGTARNAIPREAVAWFAVPADQAPGLEDRVARRLADWRQRFAEADPEVKLTCAATENTSGQAISKAERDNLLDFLNLAANGVAQMSPAFPGVVETSDNLGVAELQGGRFNADFLVRSLHDTGLDTLAEALIGQAGDHGMRARTHGAYPGWAPEPDSPLLALCQQVYTTRFGHPASLQVIHAGLECGLISNSHPQLDMISFGPDIRGAHAPGERVDIASVGRCWELLKAVLQALAEK